MLKPLFTSMVAAILLVGAGTAQSDKKSAYNKADLEVYLRHLWVLPPTLTVAIGDPQPSDVQGLQEVKVKVSQGEASQEVLLYVTKDGSKILQGTPFDMSANPFKKDLDKLKMQGQPSLGTPGAPVVLVLFSDFQCPFCKGEAEMLRKNLIAAYPTQVRLYFMDFPLEQLHPWAKAAAIGGRCVFGQDPSSFWDYYDWIYAHQESITVESLKSVVNVWAKDRKDVDALQLGRCMDTKETEKEVDAELVKGRDIQIEATPTVFVNGRRFSDSLPWEKLKATIDNEIEYQKVAKNAGEDCGCEVKTLNVPGLPKPGTSPIKKQ